MTVKEALNVLKNAKEIKLCYGSDVIPFHMDNPLCKAAFADYLVDYIDAIEEDNFEINIAMRPLKAGEA